MMSPAKGKSCAQESPRPELARDDSFGSGDVGWMQEQALSGYDGHRDKENSLLRLAQLL